MLKLLCTLYEYVLYIHKTTFVDISNLLPLNKTQFDRSVGVIIINS